MIYQQSQRQSRSSMTTKTLLAISLVSVLSIGTTAQDITLAECAERLPKYDMDFKGTLSETEFVNFLLGQKPYGKNCPAMTDLDDFSNFQPGGKYHKLFVESACVCEDYDSNDTCCSTPTIEVEQDIYPDGYMTDVCTKITTVLKANCYPSDFVQSAVEEDEDDAARSIDIEEDCGANNERWWILIPIFVALIELILILILAYRLHKQKKKTKKAEEELARIKGKRANAIYPQKNRAVADMEEACEVAIAGANKRTLSNSSRHVDKTEGEEGSESHSEWSIDEIVVITEANNGAAQFGGKTKKESRNLIK